MGRVLLILLACTVIVSFSGMTAAAENVCPEGYTADLASNYGAYAADVNQNGIICVRMESHRILFGEDVDESVVNECDGIFVPFETGLDQSLQAADVNGDGVVCVYLNTILAPAFGDNPFQVFHVHDN